MSSLRDSYGFITGTTRFLSASFTADGLATGDPNMNVNGSVTPVEFWMLPDVGTKVIIEYISLFVSDDGTMVLENYGNVVGPLANGVQLFLERSGFKFDFSLPFTNNGQLIRLAKELEITSLGGGVRTIGFKEIISDFADGIFLDGNTADKIGFRIQDDLSTLTAHFAHVKGKQYTAN